MVMQSNGLGGAVVCDGLVGVPGDVFFRKRAFSFMAWPAPRISRSLLCLLSTK